ncbi:hypothetical protein ABMA57_05785 [Saccharospirillum sp. HFRX-1]|uniref:hypothetical protein n=1 Tax=unclassified Saccharospirillum TaxID=2633430 RepID=UPI0037229213
MKLGDASDCVFGIAKTASIVTTTTNINRRNDASRVSVLVKGMEQAPAEKVSLSLSQLNLKPPQKV